MPVAKADRRAGRTRELLQNALIDLIREGSHDTLEALAQTFHRLQRAAILEGFGRENQ